MANVMVVFSSASEVLLVAKGLMMLQPAMQGLPLSPTNSFISPSWVNSPRRIRSDQGVRRHLQLETDISMLWLLLYVVRGGFGKTRGHSPRAVACSS
mmetsp:Transcript_97316/g.251767  ORF Transcript_97316/g.251767 Transcript_97316/m.251767 type:complete len:97 (-) Transcript_97316:137-427(-)